MKQVRNTTTQCYLDKSLGHVVRNRSSPEYIPTVVAQARMVLRRKELLKELEEARRGMYSFMRSSSQQSGRDADGDHTFLTEADEDSEEEDQLDIAVRNNQVHLNINPSNPIYMLEKRMLHQSSETYRESNIFSLL